MSGTANGTNGTAGDQPAANVTGQLAALAAPTLPSNISAALTPDKFDGTNFKQWQQKMHFFLTTLNLAKYLVETKPEVPATQEANPDPRVHMTLENWNKEISCAKVTFKVAWWINCSMCTVRSKHPRSCGKPWIRSTRRSMWAQENLLLQNFSTS
ncbi:unnamed protein product [Microthlaspi erraticum]|uniref:Retrotransposon Copia-like N-terminal domain-containing protein n=1 Tax=Microthlaspi erraticum TaxID=1685480 RepID=A0A6D2J9H2_9BRAS|nr:unnamed protein product [Microthlaspi erraticum]